MCISKKKHKKRDEILFFVKMFVFRILDNLVN